MIVMMPVAALAAAVAAMVVAAVDMAAVVILGAALPLRARIRLLVAVAPLAVGMLPAAITIWMTKFRSKSEHPEARPYEASGLLM